MADDSTKRRLTDGPKGAAADCVFIAVMSWFAAWVGPWIHARHPGAVDEWLLDALPYYATAMTGFAVGALFMLLKMRRRTNG